MLNFLFDTVTFNRIVERGIVLENLRKKGFKYFRTHLQPDEVEDTKDLQKLAQLQNALFLFDTFEIPTEPFILVHSKCDRVEFTETVVPTQSAVWGVSKYGQANWTAVNNLYEPIKKELEICQSGKNHIHDALIAETVIKNDMILVSDDRTLVIVVKKFKGQAESFDDFVKRF